MIIRAVFTEDGTPNGFYPDDVWPDGYPENAVEITREQWEELLEYQGLRKFVDGQVVEYVPPVPMPTIAEYQTAIQSLIDTTAQQLQYDSGATLASYVNSTIPQWSDEARAFVAWRDQVWAYALIELAKVQSGERPQPSVEDFLAELPVFEWPTAA